MRNSLPDCNPEPCEKRGLLEGREKALSRQFQVSTIAHGGVLHVGHCIAYLENSALNFRYFF